MPTATVSDVAEALDAIRWARPQVIVWGDLCEDVYRHVRREGNRYVYTEGEFYYGMAGGVSSACRAIGVDVVPEYDDPCCTHERTLCDGELVSWVEIPRDTLDSPPIFQRRWSRTTQHATALLISDYGRGTVTPDGLREVIDAANEAGVPCIVDPHRQADWSRYAGASVIKASAGDAHAAAVAIGDNHASVFPSIPPSMPDCDVVTTYGHQGMKWTTRQVAESRFTQLFPTEPIDPAHPCGAGDVVLAALGCAVACGIDLARACRLANVCAACKCRRLGPLNSREELMEYVRGLR